MNTTKKLTFAAVACALSLALLFVASVVKTGTLAFQYAVGLTLMLAVSRSGIFYGISSYVATVVLSLVLLPDKTAATSYLLFFGAIPIVKYFAEKCGRITEWIVKIIFINIFICGLYFAFKAVLITYPLPAIYLWIAAFITAVLYDILLSFGFSFLQRYFNKIS